MSIRSTRRILLAGVAAAASVWGTLSAQADEQLDVVATFSILSDMTAHVGGDRINLVTLVGPNGDAHAFFPEPSHARALAQADLVVVNGLGFEGWMDRLVEASSYEGPIVVATDGIDVIDISEEHHDEEVGHADHTDHADHDEHADHDDHAGHDDHADHDDHAGHDDHAEHDDHAGHEHDAHAGHDHGDLDPHAWQDLANTKTYVRNILAALIEADPEGHEIYEANAARYLEELDALDTEIRTVLENVPESRRVVVTSHDAFGYLGRAYGITFLAPEGLSTEDEPSAAEMAALIRQIREQGVTAVFIENIADNRVIEQIVAETDATVGGTLYSDALSGPDGLAPTYLELMRHNAMSLTAAMLAF